MFNPSAIRRISLLLILLSALLASVAIVERPSVLRQPHFWVGVAELAALLVIYTVAAVWLPGSRRNIPVAIWRIAALFGFLTGAAELVNLSLETWWPALARGAVSVVFMVSVFVAWGCAGPLAARATRSMRTGVIAAVVSAALCMLIAVPAGFGVEMFLHTADPASVAQWAEFQRSGWTNATDFALANTLDSGFTHLLIAPFVAALFGFVGSWLATLRPAHPVEAH